MWNSDHTTLFMRVGGDEYPGLVSEVELNLRGPGSTSETSPGTSHSINLSDTTYRRSELSPLGLGFIRWYPGLVSEVELGPDEDHGHVGRVVFELLEPLGVDVLERGGRHQRERHQEHVRLFARLGFTRLQAQLSPAFRIRNDFKANPTSERL